MALSFSIILRRSWNGFEERWVNWKIWRWWWTPQLENRKYRACMNSIQCLCNKGCLRNLLKFLHTFVNLQDAFLDATDNLVSYGWRGNFAFHLRETWSPQCFGHSIFSLWFRRWLLSSNLSSKCIACGGKVWYAHPAYWVSASNLDRKPA